MISELEAFEFISELQSLDFFNERGSAGIKVLRDTLRQSANNAAHARQVIDACLEQHGCPEPADIRRIAAQVLEEPWAPTPETQSGEWETWTEFKDAGAGPQEYSFARRRS